MVTSIGSGLGSSIGTAIESTWGTWVTPTKWLEYDSESLEWKPNRIVGSGLYNGGLTQRNSQRQQVTATVEGDIKANFYYKGMGQYLGSLMGSLTGTPVAQNATLAYLQTHTLANNYNQSISIQKGVPDLTGLINQINYYGCKVTKAVFECSQDGYLTANFSFDGKDQDLVFAYGTPTYQTPNPVFAFNQGSFNMGGALGQEVLIEGVRKWTLTIERPMRVDNFYLDSTGRKQQQIQNGFTIITVDLESDYISNSAFVAQFTSDTLQSMCMDFIGPSIATSGGAKTITAVTTSATGAVVTAATHGFVNGQLVTIAGVTGTGAPSPNGTWVVDSVATNTFRIRQNNTGFTYTSGGTATLTHNNFIGFECPALRWVGEPPKVGGPDIVQPKMKLQGFFDDTNAAAKIRYLSTDTTL